MAGAAISVVAGFRARPAKSAAPNGVSTMAGGDKDQLGSEDRGIAGECPIIKFNWVIGVAIDDSCHADLMRHQLDRDPCRPSGNTASDPSSRVSTSPFAATHRLSEWPRPRRAAAARLITLANAELIISKASWAGLQDGSAHVRVSLAFYFDDFPGQSRRSARPCQYQRPSPRVASEAPGGVQRRRSFPAFSEHATQNQKRGDHREKDDVKTHRSFNVALMFSAKAITDASHPISSNRGPVNPCIGCSKVKPTIVLVLWRPPSSCMARSWLDTDCDNPAVRGFAPRAARDFLNSVRGADHRAASVGGLADRGLLRHRGWSIGAVLAGTRTATMACPPLFGKDLAEPAADRRSSKALRLDD